MNAVTTRTATTDLAAAVQAYKPATGDLRGLIAAKREGIPILPCDMTPARVKSIRSQLSAAQAVSGPVTPEVVAGWMKKLAALVSNPPAPAELATVARSIFEVCSDIPLGAWNNDARMAWCRQPDRNGYPVGSRWPAPGELRNVLLPFAEAIKREVAVLTGLIAIADHGFSEVRPKRTATEMQHVSASLAKLREEWANNEELSVQTDAKRDSIGHGNAQPQ